MYVTEQQYIYSSTSIHRINKFTGEKNYEIKRKEAKILNLITCPYSWKKKEGFSINWIGGS